MIRVCSGVGVGEQHCGCGNTGMLNFNFRLKVGGMSNPLGSRAVSLSKQITFEMLTGM